MGGDVTLERTGPGGSTFLWRSATAVLSDGYEAAHVDASSIPIAAKLTSIELPP